MFKVQRKDNTTFMAHVTDTPIFDVGGGVKFIVGVSADYSQLHDVMDQLEVLNSNLEQEVQARTQQLLERESVLRRVGAAVRESDTAVLITNEDSHIVWANSAVFKMLAVEQDSVLGALPWTLPLAPEKHTMRSSGNPTEHRTLEEFFQSVMVRYSNCKQNTAPLTMTATILTNRGRIGGATKHVVDVVSVSVQRLSSSLHQSANGEESKDEYMITLRDISADRVAEGALLLAEKASATSQAKTEMMRMLSHELRTPLQGIMGTASTLLADTAVEIGASMFDSLSMILASSRLLLTLINNVLDSGKIDSNMLNEIELAPVPVMTAMRDSMKFCEPFASLNEIQLVLTDDNGNRQNSLATTSTCYVMGNRMRLEQIIVNLMSNSIKYTTSGTAIEVSSRCCSARRALNEASVAAKSDLTFMTVEQLKDLDDSGDVVIISVRDYGPGIPPAEYGKVFGEYSQLEVSRDKDRHYEGGHGGQSSGSGLGLNLAMRFVRMMSGHIWFNNCATGGGVVFSFCIPRFKDAVVHDHRDDNVTPEDEEMDPAVASRFRVLVVDDSMINLKVLSRMLKRIGVEHIETACNGLVALNYLLSSTTQHWPNLLLVDLQMPVMDGFELMANLRDRDLQANPLIVACSADWAPETEELCNEYGFDGLLRKPITFSDIKTFLSRTAREDPDRFLS